MIVTLMTLGSSAILFWICSREKNTCSSEVQDRIDEGETVITQYGNDSITET